MSHFGVADARRRGVARLIPRYRLLDSRAANPTAVLMSCSPTAPLGLNVPCSAAMLRNSLESRPPTVHGAGDGTRTRNLLITNQLLYQLSYASLGTIDP